ncbi:hypothetical protein K432DRAFT_418753 [Lepidopterella palustris CBS 459.81]|uniref:Uncharacterized protein n=1 Tax=Lepidopterella palustris CBS 459.81 TaxID=1314670 RepID=A0A8E2JC71_9PEZI|nr:hypothetical protein K432DRAFT_418753 [Lepidopterella palustris CBS 459.81]
MVEIGTGMIEASKKPAIKVTCMPGKHVPPEPLSIAIDILKAVSFFISRPRIYISGNALKADEPKISQRYKGQIIDLILIYLGSTTIPSPLVPLWIITMDAKQESELLQLIETDPYSADSAINDYNVFLSPLSDFKKAAEEAGLSPEVVNSDRKDQHKFKAK